MSIYMVQSFRIGFAFSVCVLLFFSIFCVLNTSAQEEKKLFIVIHDSETNIPLEENIFFEGKKYDIAIGCEGEYGYVYNVTVSIPWKDPYVTSEELPWITIETPDFEDYSEFVITASKEGYVSAEQEIIVLKGELSVTIDRGTVEEKESFSVIVWDQNDNRVGGSVIYLDVNGSTDNSYITGSNGVAYLPAPEVADDTEINIKAFKKGYSAGSTSIRVENIPSRMLMDGLVPIIVAVLSVILAMLFVRVRRELSKPSFKFKKDISNQKEKIVENKKENLTVKNNPKIDEGSPIIEKGPWVEEIKIQQPEKKKGTDYVVEEAEKEFPSDEKGGYEWFKGKDYVRRRIDELTGDIEEKKEDKWFEGVGDIKSKVDKKLRKSGKEKDKKK